MNVLGSSLSALLGQSKKVATTSNNIANLGTDGFKAEQTRFVSQDPAAGGGVRTFQTSQITQPGYVRQSPNALDLSISGNGFFAVDSGDGEINFTRDGTFSPDANGDLRNNSGSRLLGFPLDDSGNPVGGNDPQALEPVNIGQNAIAAQATTQISFSGNLDAASDPADPGVDFSRSVQVFDTLGTEQDLTFEFEASGTNQFDLTIRDGNSNVLGTQTLEFDTSGQLNTPADGQVELTGIDFGNGSAPQDVTVDLSGTTQFSDSFSIQNIDQNGFGAGNLSSVTVGEDGRVTARFSNGAEQDIAQVPVADFAAPNKLQPLSGNLFRETEASGDVNLNVPGQGGTGRIQPGSIEGSNVNLTQEMVNLIESDVAFKAALAAIRTEEEQTDSLLDILS